VLFAIAVTYALSGPVLTLLGLRQHRGRRDHAHPVEEHSKP